MQILLIEDHLPTAQSVALFLGRRHCITHVDSRERANECIAHHDYEAIIVDLHLPDGSGLQFCQPRVEETDPRVIVLSGSRDVRTKVLALEAGADDYITKPFSLAELQARLAAVVRRTGEKTHSLREDRTPQVVEVGPLHISAQDTVVAWGGQLVQLTKNEHHLLFELAKRPSHILSKESLGTSSNAIEAHIRNIRHKLQLTTRDHVLETVYGLGYRINPK